MTPVARPRSRRGEGERLRDEIIAAADELLVETASEDAVSIRAVAARHRDAGLAAVTGEHYEGGHWLGSFATYLVTGRGLTTPTIPPATGTGFR